MYRIHYFGEYSLSEGTKMKLEKNRNILAKVNAQPSDLLWNSLFKIEEPERIVPEKDHDLIEVDEDKLSQNSAPEVHHQDSMLSQFVITQAPKKNLSTYIPESSNQTNGSKLMNFVESILEVLEDTNRTLKEDDLKDINYSDIEEIMEKLSSQLSLDGVYNLCNSLCLIDINVAVQYIKTVLSKILLQRIIALEKPQQATKKIPIIVGKLTEKFPEDVRKWIFIPMINSELKDSTVTLTIIKCCAGRRKLELISDFLLTARELRLWHIIILPSMIDMKIDDKMKDQLLTLLVEKALLLSKDKNYSKFILSFIKLNRPFTDSQMRMLEEIVAVNETIFRVPMTKVL